MRVFLQNVETLQFFYGGNRWGRQAEQALDFEKGERAAQFISTSKLQNVRIIFRFEPRENRPDIYLPLGKERRTESPR